MNPEDIDLTRHGVLEASAGTGKKGGHGSYGSGGGGGGGGITGGVGGDGGPGLITIAWW